MVYDTCIYITLIGSLVIIVKKHISRQIVKRIPKSNILPQHKIDLEQPSESFQMVTLHSTPRIIEVKPINETDTGIIQLPCQFSDVVLSYFYVVKGLENILFFQLYYT